MEWTLGWLQSFRQVWRASSIPERCSLHADMHLCTVEDPLLYSNSTQQRGSAPCGPEISEGNFL